MKLEYTVLAAGTLVELVAQVEVAIADGWEPQGGVSFMRYFNDANHLSTYVQAMIRRAKEADDPTA